MRAKNHGKSRTKIYYIWRNIKNRCYMKKLKSYKNYGGRGITMQNNWINDFLKFEKYIKTLDGFDYSELGLNGLTLDRINNDGNYEEGNLRLANRTIQARNTRKRKDNKSGFVGVSYIKKNKTFQVNISVNKELIYLGCRKDVNEAYQLRVDYIIENNLQGFEIELP